jgi:hypothetical protein
MKKTLLALSFFFAVVTCGQAQIVINELMYNPPESGTDSLEYIELLNNSGSTVDLSNWTFSLGVVYTFPAGTTIAANGYVVIAKSISAFKSVFGFEPLQWTAGSLSNSGEPVEIKDGNGNVIDNVSYLPAAPWPTDANGGGASLVLCDPNSDNSLAVNWQACQTHTGININGKEVKGNPNAPSACGAPNQLSATNDHFIIPTGATRILNILGNDALPNPVTSLTIVANPTHGTVTVNGLNSITYTAAAGYCGPDQFQYKVCDASLCDTATVTLADNCYTGRTIAQMTTQNGSGVLDSLNKLCELQGTVYGPNFRPTNNNLPALLFTIIDDNGNGIAVSSLGGQFGYTVNEKDKIKVWGKINQFNGLAEIDPDTIIKVSSNNPLLNPVVVTALGESTESKLVKINNLHFVNSADWTTGVGTSGFNANAVSSDHPTDTITIRIDRDIETFNAPVPAEPFDLTGIGGQFDSSTPFTSGYQITPRYNKDISTLNAIHEVDFSSNVSLSPNPATDFLLVNTNIAFDRIIVFTSEGRFARNVEKPAPSERIQLANLPAGAYFIRFEKADGVWTTRFVKM